MVASTGHISSPSDSLIITSPTPSASSLSSSGFGFVAVKPRSTDSGNAGTNTAATPVHPGPDPQFGEESSFSDDDEIVWGVSESDDLEGSTSGLRDVLSDDDFVVLSRTRSPVSNSRTRTTSESIASRAGTIRGVPPHSGLLAPHPSVSYPQGADVAAEVAEDKVIASELAKELAKLSIEDESLAGEASGTRTPVREAKPNLPETLLKKKGKKKERTPEEEALRKQRRKERKERRAKEKREKKAAKALKKNSPPVAPELSKNTSTATLVPSSITNASHIAPQEGATPVPAIVPLPSPPSSPVKTPGSPKKKKKSKKAKAAETSPLQRDTEQSDKSAPTPYDEAVSYITSYISNASAHGDPICHLTLLQSLIIELGLIKDVSLLPHSIKAAKKFIKLRVFLNVKEYLKKRHEGPQIVRSLMFTSRSALVKDLRQKKNYASLQWIKKHGLKDLLVGVFRH